MGHSIQEYLKKINSNLTWMDCISLLVTTIILLVGWVYLYTKQLSSNSPVSYIKNEAAFPPPLAADSRPFASVNGKTYTFSWCQNSKAISTKNRIYFVDEAAAKASGRNLSLLCQK
jgi:hypothetical protein